MAGAAVAIALQLTPIGLNVAEKLIPLFKGENKKILAMVQVLCDAHEKQVGNVKEYVEKRLVVGAATTQEQLDLLLFLVTSLQESVDSIGDFIRGTDDGAQR